MDRELHDALSRAAEATRVRDRLRAQREQLVSRLAFENARRAELRARLEAERRDVARLEGISLEPLFAAIAARLEPTLDEERREADLAELRFVEQGQLVAALTSELGELDRRIAALGDVDALHRAALEAKARVLMGRDDDHGRLVLALVERFSEASAMGRELREALDCGHALAARLADAAAALGEASRHGAWDVWIGGGLVTTMQRHAVLDQASRHMQASSILLERFRKELSDVGRGMAVRTSFLTAGAPSSLEDKITDYMLGSLGDVVLHKRIQRTTNDLVFVRQEVQRCIDELSRAFDDEHRAWQEAWARLAAAITAV